MKKFLLLLTVFALSFSLAACNENKEEPDQNQPAEDNTEIEIKIDYVAEQLGLTDESEVLYGLIGAVAGKQYSNGNIELYQFDENSQAYKDLIGRKTYLIPAAYKDGVVLIFALGTETDQDLVDAFNALEF